MKLLCQITSAVSATLFLLSGCASGPSMESAGNHHFKGDVGLQLYSLRGELGTNVDSGLQRAASFGIKNVEMAGTYNLKPEEFKAKLEKFHLTPISGHYNYDMYRTNAEGIAREAKMLGLKYVGCAWITHDGDFNEATCRQAIEVFNKAGEIMAKNGMKFFYHTHGYEFQPYKNGTLFDLLLQGTNPQFVNFEMDVFWIVHPGQNPAALFAKYPSRFQLVHLKDMRKGTPTGLLTGHSDVTNDVALGTGTLDWKSILSAAEKAGVKYYFIEDESPTSAAQIPQTLAFLKQFTW